MKDHPDERPPWWKTIMSNEIKFQHMPCILTLVWQPKFPTSQWSTKKTKTIKWRGWRGCGAQQNTKLSAGGVGGGVGHSRTPSYLLEGLEGVWGTAEHQAICWRGWRGCGTQQNTKLSAGGVGGGVGHSGTPSYLLEGLEGVWDTAEHQARGCGTQQNSKLSAIHPVNMNPEQNVNRSHKNNWWQTENHFLKGTPLWGWLSVEDKRWHTHYWGWFLGFWAWPFVQLATPAPWIPRDCSGAGSHVTTPVVPHKPNHSL